MSVCREGRCTPLAADSEGAEDVEAAARLGADDFFAEAFLAAALLFAMFTLSAPQAEPNRSRHLSQTGYGVMLLLP